MNRKFELFFKEITVDKSQRNNPSYECACWINRYFSTEYIKTKF